MSSTRTALSLVIVATLAFAPARAGLLDGLVGGLTDALKQALAGLSGATDPLADIVRKLADPATAQAVLNTDLADALSNVAGFDVTGGSQIVEDALNLDIEELASDAAGVDLDQAPATIAAAAAQALARAQKALEELKGAANADVAAAADAGEDALKNSAAAVKAAAAAVTPEVAKQLKDLYSKLAVELAKIRPLLLKAKDPLLAIWQKLQSAVSDDLAATKAQLIAFLEAVGKAATDATVDVGVSADASA